MKKSSPFWKSLRLGLAVLAGLVIYAYGFQVTQVDLEEFRKPERQERRLRVMRELARPDLLAYEQEEFIVSAPLRVPCPPEGYSAPAPDTSGPYLIVTPACADPLTEVTVEGHNFPARTRGPVSFIPSTDPNDTLALQPLRVEADSSGSFILTYKLPNRPSEETQYLRATLRRNVGLPHLTETARITWDKIVETVFLALLATTIGTVLSVPISFFAARNLMKDVKSPQASVALSILFWPAGIYLGFALARILVGFNHSLAANLGLNLGGAIISPLLAWAALRWAFNQPEGLQGIRRYARSSALILVAPLSALALLQISSLGLTLGKMLKQSLGNLTFIGNFIYQSADILLLLFPFAFALLVGAVLGSYAGRMGQSISEKLSPGRLKIVNIFLGAAAGATLFAILGVGLNWFYEINNPLTTILLPAATGAFGGLLLTLRANPKDPLGIGLAIYYVTRTILNAVRSIEALIMAIVAVIWVGIGPFAGTLALALHTVASLAKLYSEQVESISAGPIEAIQATGATRLQTIIYAVVPQIIPPYISFTMYRWDINVRMSTIIGFAGGGGIGFLLQQNINLLNYRAASMQMLAIAIVVALMDYLSSTLRERYV